MTETQITIAALATLGCITFLFWKDNPIFTFLEHVSLAGSAAYIVGNTYHRYIVPTVRDDIIGNGELIWILPCILGLLIYFKYSSSLGWVARYPMSFWVGYGAGWTLADRIAPMLTQVRASFFNINSLDTFIVFLAFVTGLLYFVFTIKRENSVMAPITSIGRYGILIALGASFGSTALYRFNLFVGRSMFVMFDWLKLGG